MLFSLLVANYNNGRYLPDLIRSILDQTFTNWELIIVDDCSDENPLKYISCFLEDPRIKLIIKNENAGAGATFKVAADNAIGEVLGMLGADDALVPEAIEIMINAHIKNPYASMINSNCWQCDEELNIIRQYVHYKALKPGQTLLRNLTIGSFATFKKWAYLKTSGFDRTFTRAVDHDIYLKLDEVGTLEYVEQPLYLYRKNAVGISQNANGLKAAQFSINAKYNAYKRRMGTDKENFTLKEIKALRITWYLREIYAERINRNKKKCNKLLKQAVKEIPGIIRRRSFITNAIKNNIFFR